MSLDHADPAIGPFIQIDPSASARLRSHLKRGLPARGRGLAGARSFLPEAGRKTGPNPEAHGCPALPHTQAMAQDSLRVPRAVMAFRLGAGFRRCTGEDHAAARSVGATLRSRGAFRNQVHDSMSHPLAAPERATISSVYGGSRVLDTIGGRHYVARDFEGSHTTWPGDGIEARDERSR